MRFELHTVNAAIFDTLDISLEKDVVIVLGMPNLIRALQTHIPDLVLNWGNNYHHSQVEAELKKALPLTAPLHTQSLDVLTALYNLGVNGAYDINSLVVMRFDYADDGHLFINYNDPHSNGFRNNTRTVSVSVYEWGLFSYTVEENFEIR